MRLKNIKFRGIPVKAKEYDFIEGDLIRTAENRYFIFPEGFELGLTNLVNGIAVYSGFGLLIEVKPETIGQFTGLKDINGVEIFDGDIIEFKDRTFGKLRGKVFFSGGVYMVDCPVEPSDGWQYENYIRDLCCIDFHLEEVKVVGNIHQNPELIRTKVINTT